MRKAKGIEFKEMPWLVRSLQDQRVLGLVGKISMQFSAQLAGMVTVQMCVEAEPERRKTVMRWQEERQQEEDNNKGGEEGLRYNWCKMDQ